MAAAVAWELTRVLPWAPGFYAPLVAALSVHPTVARTLREPVHVRTAERALTSLRLAVGEVVDEMSRDVAADSWPPPSPDVLEQTRRLQEPLTSARDAVDRGSESVRLSPRARRIRAVPRRQREALTALEYIVVDVRQMARTLTDAAGDPTSSFVLEDRFRPRFADAMHSVAGALTAYGDEQATPDAAAAREPVETAGAQLTELQETLASAGPEQVASLVADGALLADLQQVVSTLERGPLHQVSD